MRNRLAVKPLFVSGAFASALLLAACGQQPAAQVTPVPTAVPAPPVAAQTATRSDIQQTLSYSGDIRAVLIGLSGHAVGADQRAQDSICVLRERIHHPCD